MFSNIALHPIIIFTDIFGKTLMKRYNNMKKATVLLPKFNGWQE